MTPQSAEPELHTNLVRLAERCLGASVSELEELEPGLGRRRFFRLALTGAGPPSVIARVEPPAGADSPASAMAPEPPLEPLRSFLAHHGLPVPACYGGATGVELLEDLGPRSLEQAAADLSAERRGSLYSEACELIARLQGLSAEPELIPAFGRRLDPPLIASKARKFVDWTLPWASPRPVGSRQREAVEHAFAWIARECSAAPARLAHRDFKAANLHLRPNAAGREELVMIDLQGAFLAPPEYDLACLLRDSHVLLPEEEVQSHLERTRTRLPDRPDAATFSKRFDLLTLIRVAKDVSHYLHAAHERGDERYLRFVPTALHNLRMAAQRVANEQPCLQRLADLIDGLREPAAPPGGAASTRTGEPRCGQ